MQCPNCYAQLPDNQPSCGFCGTVIYNQMQYTTDANNPAFQYNQPYPNYPNYQDMNQYNQQAMSYQPTTISNGGKKGPNKPLLIGIISFAIVALILGIALIVKGGKDKDDDDKTTEATTTEITTTEATTTEAPTTAEATTTEAPTTTEATTTEATTTEDTTTEDTTTDATATLHGTYELTSTTSMGQSFTVEEMEAMSGETYAMTLTINSGFCLVDASEMGAGQGLATITLFDDNTLELDDGVETITGTYDPETDTITLTMDGVDMIFEKVE